ncbi:MAG: hypothetical protein ACREUW_12905 [Burkholderiales bacterium]
MTKAKRKMSGAVGVLAVSLLAASVTAEAAGGRERGGVNQRQSNQQHRIEQGVRQGDLTRNEARNLGQQQRHIAREETRYRADGHLSHGERADLRHDQNQANRDIRRERHDGDRYGWRQDGRFDSRHDGRFDRRGPPQGYGSQHGYGPHAQANIDHRQFDQGNRIQQGIRSGELTRGEARQLLAEQGAIRQEERLYRSDGTFTRDERREVQQDLNAASRHIYNETHDAQEQNRYRR